MTSFYRGIHPTLPDEPEKPRIELIRKPLRTYPGIHADLPIEVESDFAEAGKGDQ